jgi:predicted RNase H-like nuclease (RuvC/YqgF family)
MAMENLVTFDAVQKAVDDLKAEGKTATVRAVRDKIGGGSFRNIQPFLKEILAVISTVPPETEERLKPLLHVAAEAIRGAIQEATEALKSDNFRLQKDQDDALAELCASERDKTEADAEIVRLKNELARVEAKLEATEKSLEELKKENLEQRKEAEEARMELSKLKIREIDYQEAKKEASQARERAAKLEGRLEELDKVKKTKN